MEETFDIVKRLNSEEFVYIYDICFKGKRRIDWDEVEKYLKKIRRENGCNFGC